MSTLPKLWLVLISLVLAGCAGTPKKIPSQATPRPMKAGEKIDQAELSPIKRAILSLAEREWRYFGRQNVVFDGDEESIPHVGMWEDDEEAYVFRVNEYWRAVGKPELNGNHCHEPWSAAFISWVMQEAGVPDYQFSGGEAHWRYLAQIAADAGNPYVSFVPRSVDEYSPQPGDLICATREHSLPPMIGSQLRPELLPYAKLHCDIVVERNGDTLTAIGGNVRNSVSKSLLKLDRKGLLQPVRQRPWFLVLENRL
jgi:uncharacterized protein DUF2272